MKKAYIIRLIFVSVIVLLSILGIFGLIYPIKIMDLQFSPIILRLFTDFSVTTLFLFAGIVVLSLIFGRIYCSTICPFGILQEVSDIFFRKASKKKKKNLPQQNYVFKYIISFICFSILLGGSTILIKYIDPYTIFSSAISISLFGIIFSIFVIVLVFFRNRFFCTNICPVGAILGLLSRFSYYKILMDKSICVSCGVCARSCPSGCINIKEGKINNELCVKCFKCIRVCPKNAINLEHEKQSIEFNFKRREAIITGSCFAVFGALCAMGVGFSKNIASKIKDIILPPGAFSANRMANKCLNCNLCVNNCPNKILSKANSDFGAIHIDFNKGKKHCKFDCKRCSEVCPTGAIKRITLEEKQSTRIAIATLNKKVCSNCGACKHTCPTGAIEKVNNVISVNGTMCIGCGKCATVCANSAITINPIKKQDTI